MRSLLRVSTFKKTDVCLGEWFKTVFSQVFAFAMEECGRKNLSINGFDCYGEANGTNFAP